MFLTGKLAERYEENGSKGKGVVKFMLMLIGVVYVISLVVFWSDLCYVHLLRQF
jgi:hypothetical protein